MSKPIKYELIIDTVKGEAQVKRALEDGTSVVLDGGGRGGGGGGGGLGTGKIAGAVALGNLAADAVKKFTTELLSATRTLSEYSAATFGATTAFDFFTEGLKFQVANELGPALSDFTFQLMDLISSVMPILIDTLKAVIPVITFALKIVTIFTSALQVAWKALRLGTVQILASIPGSGFGAGDVTTARTELNEAMDNLADAVKGNTQATIDSMRTGAILSMGLFNAAAAWSQTAVGHGPQAVAAEGVFMADPGPGGAGRARAAMGGRGRPPRFPRPQPAAVHLKMADDININATDEDRIGEQMTLLKLDILAQLSGMLDGRWLRVLMARNMNTMGFGTGQH